MSDEYLKERARKGSRAKFERVLAKVRDVPPLAGDEPDKAPVERKGRRPLRRWKGRRRPLAKGAPRSRSRE